MEDFCYGLGYDGQQQIVADPSHSSNSLNNNNNNNSGTRGQPPFLFLPAISYKTTHNIQECNSAVVAAAFHQPISSSSLSSNNNTTMTFHSHNAPTPAVVVAAANQNVDGSMDWLVHHHFQQCWQYHLEQEEIRRRQAPQQQQQLQLQHQPFYAFQDAYSASRPAPPLQQQQPHHLNHNHHNHPFMFSQEYYDSISQLQQQQPNQSPLNNHQQQHQPVVMVKQEVINDHNQSPKVFIKKEENHGHEQQLYSNSITSTSSFPTSTTGESSCPTATAAPPAGMARIKLEDNGYDMAVAETTKTTASSAATAATVANAATIMPQETASGNYVKDEPPAQASLSPTSTTTTPAIPASWTTLSLFQQQRQVGFTRERERLQRAWVKNLQYIAQQEENRARALTMQIEAAKRAELQQKAAVEAAVAAVARQRQQQEQQERMGRMASSAAGIGTKQRQRVQRKMAKEHAAVINSTDESKQQQQQQDDDNDDCHVALYVSGLPTNGSVTQDFIQQLFASYGSIKKIHFYRNHHGQLKGDGLVVYSIDQNNENDINDDDKTIGKESKRATSGQDLSRLVCSQLNGAELSVPQGDDHGDCSFILHVEPADSNYSKKRSSSNNNNDSKKHKRQKQNQVGLDRSAKPVASTPTAVSTAVDAGTENNIDDNDDVELDDFFASL